MARKENHPYAGNKSLLQTARSKTFGAGKFVLLSRHNNPKAPVKKVNVPILRPGINGRRDKTFDESSKVSDITASIEEEPRPYRLPPTSKITGSGNAASNNQTIHNNQDEGFNNPMRTALKRPLILAGGKRKTLVAVSDKDKKTIDISKGLKFSAPAPMTLNRCEPQPLQEKTTPESKEYLKMQAQKQREEQKKIEAEHIAEAKLVIEERLKQEFELEKEGAGFAHLNEFDVKNEDIIEGDYEVIKDEDKK